MFYVLSEEYFGGDKKKIWETLAEAKVYAKSWGEKDDLSIIIVCVTTGTIWHDDNRNDMA